MSLNGEQKWEQMWGRIAFVVIIYSNSSRTAFGSCWQSTEGPQAAAPLPPGFNRFQRAAPITVRSDPGVLGGADTAYYLRGQGRDFPFLLIITPVMCWGHHCLQGCPRSKPWGNSFLPPNFVYNHMWNWKSHFFFLRPEVKKQLCCDKYTHTKEKQIEKDPGKGNDMHSELKN